MISFQKLAQWQTQSSRVVEHELGFWTHVRRWYDLPRLVRITRSRPGHCQSLRPPGQALVIWGPGPGHSGWDGNAVSGWPVQRCRPGAWAARGRSNEPDPPTCPGSLAGHQYQRHGGAVLPAGVASESLRVRLGARRASGRRRRRAPSAGPAADAVPTGAPHARSAPSPTARRGPARRGRQRCQLEFQQLNLKLHGGTPSPGGPVADRSEAPPRRHASRKIASHKAAVAVASA
jgi:hypothetical protein